MRVKTSRFGEINVADDQVLTFTHPIIGFPEHRRFVLLPGPQDGLTFWLQSTEDGALAFILIDPRVLMARYEAAIGPHELDELGAMNSAELNVYTLVVVPADTRDVRTNLKAPVLVNPKTRLAKQTILEKSDYPIRYYLQQRQTTPRGFEEAIDAGSNA